MLNRKTDTIITGAVILSLIAGVYILQTYANGAVRSGRIPLTAFPSELAGDPVRGVFEGITPCDGVNRPLPQIPENTNCEQMIWKLILDQDAASGQPTTYHLMSAYGLSQQGTTGLQNAGTQLNLEGNWTIGYGTKANPNAVVYQLNPDDPQASIHFVKLDDNLLHLLAQDKALMVGNGAWSYTLNRTDKRIVSGPAAATADLMTPAVSSLANPEAAAGVFEGRIPCAERAMTLNNISAPGCQRVKMQLTLEHNPETHTPTTFEILIVYVGMGDTQYKKSGTWVIFQNSSGDPQTVVYQLNPSGSQQPILLLKADDNNLFFLDSDFNLMAGDALLSFTLSRSDE